MSFAPAHRRGAVLALLGCFGLAMMNALIKWNTQNGYPTAQIIFGNGMIGLICLSGWMLWKRSFDTLKTIVPAVAFYVVLGVAACYGLFYAFGRGNLGDISTIVATVPLMVATLAAIFLREKMNGKQMLLVALAFAGIIMILKPNASMTDYTTPLVALGATVLLAASQLMVRKLSTQVAVMAFPFCFYTGLVLTSGISSASEFVPVMPKDAPFLLLSGFCDVASLMLLYSAYKAAPAPFVAPFQFSQILWGILTGYFIWAETPDALALAGASVVLISGILFVRNQS